MGSSVYEQYSLVELLSSDLSRMGVVPRLTSFLRWYVRPGGVPYRYVVWYRIFSYVKRKRLLRLLAPFTYFVLRHYEFKYDVHADTNIEIGPGLQVVHGGAVYLHAARIGSNFTIYQGCTLGRNRGGCLRLVMALQLMPAQWF